MSRTRWSVYTQTGSGGTWALTDDVFYAPNETMEKDKTSTLSATKLATGSLAYVSPETKFNLEPVTMIFLGIETGDEFSTNLNSYVENQTYIKLIDAFGNVMMGIFTGLKEVWLLGEADTHDYQATFVRIE